MTLFSNQTRASPSERVNKPGIASAPHYTYDITTFGGSYPPCPVPVNVAFPGSSLLGFCWPALRVGPPPWIHMSAVSFRTSTSCDPQPRSLFCPPASPVLAPRPYPRGVPRRTLTIQHNRQAGAGEAEGPGTVCPFRESMDR